MKLVVLMYLQDDQPQVERLLAAHDVVAWSELPIEGHGLGTAGWYGKVAPYRSRMLISVISAAKADELMEAIASCTGCSDPSHPIHAWQMDVQRSITSGNPPAPWRA